MKWSEGHIHLAMRRSLVDLGWLLIAGEYPGGSDHDLYPLNVLDPSLARDGSPDPRRHSQGELIPDLIALRSRDLLIGEAKVFYDRRDQSKLESLIMERKNHLLTALQKFAIERRIPSLLPIDTLVLRPTLVFLAECVAPPPATGFSYLRINGPTAAFFEGDLSEATK